MLHTRYLLPFLLLPLSCGGTPEHHPEHGAAQAPAHAGPAGAPLHGEHEGRDHRDRHGPPSLERYIKMLASEKRVAELRVADTLSALDLPADAVVADVGCGPGVFTLPLARACPSGVIYGADVEPGQLDALRTGLKKNDLTNVVPVLASYHDPHLPPGRVDLILISDTWHHIDDRPDYLRRLEGYLAPGGRLAFVEYKPGDIPVGPPGKHKLAAGQREAELAAAGWKRLESFDLHTWHDFETWQPIK
ncbi:MAG: SAM-dependent methyltransferase [Planctomycetes bacterium]|jgi:SAM-dependent methyltransferase|nr:SAM-dependent methyltransferase [Planctomycetota bacterium]HJO26377.1 class I SAM-dependent methyltransferase [Planctomycetota bacterium]